MVVVEGIDYSSGWEIDLVAAEAIARLVGGCFVVVGQRRYFVGYLLEFLEASLAVACRAVAGLLHLRQHRNRDHLWLHRPLDSSNQRRKNCLLWRLLVGLHTPNRRWNRQGLLLHRNHTPSPHPY
jgi:hypothetical protein